MAEAEKHIIHLDQDAFFVSVELRKNAALKGKPVIIGGLSDRGVVASCSYEARQYGVHSAMSSRLARQLCPQAVFVRGNMQEYTEASLEITEIIAERAPLYEKASIDEHYIDLTGMERFFGCMQFSKELRQRIIHETGLPISFGLSVNKTVAKMATNESKPNGQLEIPALGVKPFLNPLVIQKIPGLGGATAKKLMEMGVKHIHTLADIPPELMFKILGKNGLALWQKANGIDDSPVQAYRARKSIGTQQTFEQDSMDIPLFKTILTRMVTELAYELRKQQKLTACITVTIRYNNFETATLQSAIPYTALDGFLIDKAHQLFDRLYSRRMLLRLIGLKLSQLVSGYAQIGMYEMAEEEYRLYQAMDKIRNNFGIASIGKASTIAAPLRDAEGKILKATKNKKFRGGSF